MLRRQLRKPLQQCQRHPWWKRRRPRRFGRCVTFLSRGIEDEVRAGSSDPNDKKQEVNVGFVLASDSVRRGDRELVNSGRVYS